MNIVGLHIFYGEQTAVPEVEKRHTVINEDKESSPEPIRLTDNLMEMHLKVLENVREKLAPYLERLLRTPNQKNTIGGFPYFWTQGMQLI